MTSAAGHLSVYCCRSDLLICNSIANSTTDRPLAVTCSFIKQAYYIMSFSLLTDEKSDSKRRYLVTLIYI